ncbi:glycyl-radical enzyme activating protein [Maribellus comscasis]|uniref:Glycyl-radical enzyme activating protein n=1 Tax=Maribellus comscasis TaxID=2681766 RepID=A0A6I6JQ37_9BACT|nr:glycyl-radical enzyme activating protein [Maribellus comscasis]QGY42227.1 glycyl-radical enzyme activating protein [Maribellus comscasis]
MKQINIQLTMIFNIQRFSTHDGNGIRTVIFYKGCPLSCWWCSNPESLSFDYSVLYNKKFCKNFGDCILTEKKAISKTKDGIQINRDLIENPEKLKNTCLSKALTISGKNKTAAEILVEIEKDILFFGKNGGVTLSGGEPFAQGENLTTLLQLLKEKKINVNVETTLYVKWDKIERHLTLVDTFLADLKHTNKEKFKKYTGGNVSLVMTNMLKLDNSGAKYIIRIPVIPGFNHSEKEMTEMIDFASSLKNAREIDFLPYHTFGIEKYKMLGIPYLMGNTKNTEDDELEPYMKYAESKGFRTKIGG